MNNDLAARLFTKACFIHAVNPDGFVFHSDNGGPMKVATMQATLQIMGVIQSFLRPMVSDDNPYLHFTIPPMKYRPENPSGAFDTFEQAQAMGGSFCKLVQHLPYPYQYTINLKAHVRCLPRT